jgi:hypothetical protein
MYYPCVFGRVRARFDFNLLVDRHEVRLIGVGEEGQMR